MGTDQVTGVKSLIVDDVADARDLLTVVFEESGFTVVVAADGAEAVQQAERHRPTIIIMDIAMPVMDGVTATQLIRQSPALRHIPVVALTAYTTSIRGTDGLFAAVLIKPCPPDRLLGKVAALLAATSDHHWSSMPI